MKAVRVLIVFLSFITLLWSSNRYEIKSGIVNYKINTTGKSFGMDMSSNGKRSLYFKEWGSIELSDESITQNIMGDKQTTRNMTKLDKKNSYSVDFDNKVIIKTSLDELAKKGKLVDKNILKDMDAKKTGTGKVLGFKCDIWNLMDSKVWIYKGVVLKSESSAMGIKTIETAVSAKFGISVPKSKFVLPDYPVKTLHQMMSEEIVSDENSENKKAPSTMPSSEQMQDMMKQFSNMFGN